MTAPPRNVAHSKKVAADNEAPDAMVPRSDQTLQPDGKSRIEHHVSDDAAGDEGIDEPAADD